MNSEWTSLHHPKATCTQKRSSRVFLPFTDFLTVPPITGSSISYCHPQMWRCNHHVLQNNYGRISWFKLAVRHIHCYLFKVNWNSFIVKIQWSKLVEEEYFEIGVSLLAWVFTLCSMKWNHFEVGFWKRGFEGEISSTM